MITVESVVADLRKGAATIQTNGWYRGGSLDRFVVSPEGLVTRLDEEEWEGAKCIALAVDSLSAIRVLGKFLNVEDEQHPHTAIYDINDSQPPETGYQWAIDTLNGCADALENGTLTLVE